MNIDTEEIKVLKEEVKNLTREIQTLKEDLQAIRETLYLLSVPGMREKILEGGRTPIEECSEEIDW
jgi:uncharacterized protein YaaN involved in tellurite resistance